MTLITALLLLQDPVADWLKSVEKADRDTIEAELAKLDVPEAADEAKFRPLEFAVGSKLAPFGYSKLVPVLLAALGKGASPMRRFALSQLRSRLGMRDGVTVESLLIHNLAVVRALDAPMTDVDFVVRKWVAEILLDLADGDTLPGDPPKSIAPPDRLKEALLASFGKLGADANPFVRASAELGASVLRDDEAERLRLRHEVEHFLTHCPQKEAIYEDLPVEKAKELRARIKATLERDDAFLIITIACEPGKGTDTPDQLKIFYRRKEGEWIETLKDPRKKK
jgi:hypothetical protein